MLIIDAQYDETETRLNIIGNSAFDDLLSLYIDTSRIFYLCLFRCEIKFPVAQEWIMLFVEQGAADIFAKNTSVFVFDAKVLLQTRSQLVVPRMRTDPNDTARTVRGFAVFKQKIETIERKCTRFKWAADSRQCVCP